jgi:hypothetical protein
VYVSAETPIRSYYTVIAVPDGADTAEFLQASGWREVADERQEGLFVLEPGLGGWVGAEDEAAYVAAAMSFYQSNSYFSIFGRTTSSGTGTAGLCWRHGRWRIHWLSSPRRISTRPV